MRKSATTDAPRAVVISLSAVRTIGLPSPEPETCDPLDVLEIMVEAYFNALSAQMAKVRAMHGLDHKEIPQ